MPPSCRTWPKTVHVIRSSVDSNADRSARNIPHPNRVRRKVAGHSMAAVAVNTNRPAAIVKAATNGLSAHARMVTSGVSVRAKGIK